MNRKVTLFSFVFLLLLIITATAQAAVNRDWVVQYNGTGGNWDSAAKVINDSLGNVYVTGNSAAGPNNSDIVTIKYDSAGNEVWQARFDQGINDVPVDMHIDSTGNLYVAGAVIISISNTGAIGDFVTIKYDSYGNQIWARTYDYNGGDDEVTALAVDNQGNVVVTGYSYNGPNRDYVTIKYDSNGNQLWVVRYDNGSNDLSADVAVDGSNNIYVTGESVSNIGQADFATIKYDVNGNQVWITRYDGGSFDSAVAVVVDSDGFVYVTGSSYNGLNYDYVILKYNPLIGSQTWISRYNNGGDDKPVSMILSKVLNNAQSPNVLYVTGLSHNGLNNDFATVAINAAMGSQLWATRYDNGGDDRVKGIIVDNTLTSYNGNIYVFGDSFNTSNYDYATVKYDSNGVQRWVERFDSGNNDSASSISVHESNIIGNYDIYVTGTAYANYTTIKYSQINIPPVANAGLDIVVEAATNVGAVVTLDGSASYDPDGDPLILTWRNAANNIIGSLQSLQLGTYTFTLTANDSNGGSSTDQVIVNVIQPVDSDGDGLPDLWELNRGLNPNDPAGINGANADPDGNGYSNLQEYLMTKVNKEWQAVPGGSNIAVDNTGNLYVATGEWNGQNSNIVLTKYNSSGGILWKATYTTGGLGSSRDIKVDSSGNIYITGEIALNSGGSNTRKIVTLEYDTNGTQQWAAIYDIGNFNFANSISLDNLGNVYVAGGTSSVGSNYDYLILKYSPTGQLINVSGYENGGYDQIFASATDSLGNIYVTGRSFHRVGAGHGIATIKYDTNGNIVWVSRYDDVNNSVDLLPLGIALDQIGNIYVTGRKNTANNYDYITIKYDPYGNKIWEAIYDSGNTDYVSINKGITLDSKGNIYISGSSLGSYGTAYVTVKYDTNGNQIWAARYGENPKMPDSHDEARAISIDKLDNVYVTGRSHNGKDYDYATIKYDTNGNLLWEARHDSGLDDQPFDMIVDSVGNVYLTGNYSTIKYSQPNIGPPYSYQESVSITASNVTTWIGDNRSISLRVKNTGNQSITIRDIQFTGVDWLTSLSTFPTLLPGQETELWFHLSTPATTTGGIYPNPLQYPAVVRVTTDRGSIFENTLNINVLQYPTSILNVTVLANNTGAPISGALVTFGGNTSTFTTDVNGQVQIITTPGSKSLFAYKNTYMPIAQTVNAVPFENNVVMRLLPGEVLVVQPVTVTPLTQQQIIDRGVNLTDPANYWVYDFTIRLGIGGTDTVIDEPSVVMPRNPPPGTRTVLPRRTISGGSSTLETTVIALPGGYNAYAFMIIPGQIKLLKEFFDVKVIIKNEATPDFVITGTDATLSLPSGLVLVSLDGVPQNATKLLGELAGGTQTETSWVVRGDSEGAHTIGVTATGNLQPFNVPVSASNTGIVKVFGKPTLNVNFGFPSFVQAGTEFTMTADITNASPIIVHGMSMELFTGQFVNVLLGTGETAVKDIGSLMSNGTAHVTYRLVPLVTGCISASRSSVSYDPKLIVTITVHNINSLSCGGPSDTTPPTITADTSPLPNGAGWNNADVTVTYSCSDAESGIAVCPAPVIVSAEGIHNITGTAYDVAGNSASTSVTVRFDKTPPVLTCPPAVDIPATVPTGTSSANPDIQILLNGISASDNLDTNISIVNDLPASLLLGTTTVTFTAADDAGNQDTCQSLINIYNQRPVAYSHTVITQEDTPVAVTINGSDPNGDSLSHIILTQPANGVLSGIAPMLSYTPNSNFNGSDSFTFIVNDGSLDSNIATVFIEVTPVNDPPVLSPIGQKIVDEGALLSFTVSGSDPDGDVLSYNAAGLPDGASFDTATKVISYTPGYGVSTRLQDSFFDVLISVSDGNLTSSERVRIIVRNVNRPPVANAGVDQHLECAGSTCPIILDGSASTDPDSTPATQDDINTYKWYEGFGTQSQNSLGDGMIISTNLTIGVHVVTLVVTDKSGATGYDTVAITVDPAHLSLFLIEKAEIDWPKNGEVTAEVKLHGKLALPVGLLPAELAPKTGISLDIAGQAGVLTQPIDLLLKGDNGSKWEYKSNTVGTGTRNFSIHWKGAKFKYENVLQIKTEFIGINETALSIDRNGIADPVSLTVNGVSIYMDAAGTITSSVPYEYDEDGEVTFTLPFELTPTMEMLVSVGFQPAVSIKVGDYYTPGSGEFELKANINTGNLTGSSRPATLQMNIALGNEGFPGSVSVSETEWKTLSVKEWKADIR